MIIDLNWTDFKTKIFNKGKLRYIDRESFYICKYDDFQCSFNKDNETDHVDFENNYKSHANKNIENIDQDGALISRPKAAKSGWTYFMCPVEFATSTLNSAYCNKYDNTNRAIVTYKIYDSNNNEITDILNEINAVKTIIDIEPNYDYEIIGGQLQQYIKPNSDIRLWVVAVPDVPEQYGGSKEMVGGVNLKYIDPTDKVHADGRVSKYMTYSASNHTNKLRLILRHDAGIKHDLMMVLETFKA